VFALAINPKHTCVVESLCSRSARLDGYEFATTATGTGRRPVCHSLSFSTQTIPHSQSIVHGKKGGSLNFA